MKYNLDISCAKSNLPDIRLFVANILEKHDYPEVEAHKLVLAVDEVCANLIIHANNCNPAESLSLSVSFNKNKSIVIEIIDKGIGFDMNKYKEPTLNELVESKRKGGLGLMLVKRIMDKIEFKSEKNSNICRLIKLMN